MYLETWCTWIPEYLDTWIPGRSLGEPRVAIRSCLAQGELEGEGVRCNHLLNTLSSSPGLFPHLASHLASHHPPCRLAGNSRVGGAATLLEGTRSPPTLHCSIQYNL